VRSKKSLKNQLGEKGGAWETLEPGIRICNAKSEKNTFGNKPADRGGKSKSKIPAAARQQKGVAKKGCFNRKRKKARLNQKGPSFGRQRW